MTHRHDVWRVWCVPLATLLWMITAGCSSPTAPTRPPTTTPPTPQPAALTIACPQAQTAASPNGNPVAVTYPAPTTAGGPVGANGASLATVTCSPPSASLFPVGSTDVRCTATAATQTAACTFAVVVTAPVPRLSRTRFLAFGDSMTLGEVSQLTVTRLGNDAPNYRLLVIPSASYPTQLLSRLRARYTAQVASLEVTNAGRAGEWAEDGAVRLPGVMSTVRPEAVLLLEGLNELSALTAMSGVLRATNAIDTMAKEVRNRGARLFLATLPPTRSTGPRAVPASLMLSLNAQIRATARGEGAVVVDLHGALSTDVTRYIGPDGAHPTEAGYERIADTFLAAIRADLEVRTP
jgi:lysophospholipase L1-like esterase